jgi:hypothetical protein
LLWNARHLTSRQSHINEFGRLWPVVELSKSVPEARTLSERLAKFVDKEAHWAAALYSTQAVDILMRKPIFAFLQMAAVAVLIFVGFLLTLSPLKMERVRAHPVMIVMLPFSFFAPADLPPHHSEKCHCHRKN